MRIVFMVVPLVLSLAACGQGSSPEPRPSRDQALEEAPIAMGNVVLPPSIAASKTFRCKDNSLVMVDFLSDGRSANVSTGPGKAAIHVEAARAGDSMTGGGWTVKGGKADDVATITAPGGKPLSCHSGPQKDG